MVLDLDREVAIICVVILNFDSEWLNVLSKLLDTITLSQRLLLLQSFLTVSKLFPLSVDVYGGLVSLSCWVVYEELNGELLPVVVQAHLLC